MTGEGLFLAGLLSLILALTSTQAYLVIISDTAPPGTTVIDAAVYKLGSERTYTIDVHRTANFVHHVLKVNRTTGLVTLKKRLKCDGVFYPNMFTFYVDSTSDRIRDINYYSLPIRILVTGEDCSRRHADLYDIDFDRVYDQDETAVQYEDDHYHKRDKRQVTFKEEIDWRLLEEDELVSSHSVLSTAYPWYDAHFEESIVDKYRIRKKRSHPLVPFDMSVDVKIAEAKQWISETYASFAIPTTDKWQGICLKNSQFVNSLTAFLPKTVQKHCKVQFLDVNDPRFLIENSQGDLVASEDLCILEPLWKVSVLFTFNCEDTNIVDSDHRLKIVYHHQELNDTDIARRVKRELRNQSPYFEQALYVASVAEEQEPGVVVTTVRARDPENSPVTYSMSSLLDSRSSGMFSVDSRTGVVTTQARLDRERLDVHYFRVLAQDDTFPPRTGTTTLQINVIDCNDHAPVFEMQQYEASVREGASPGTTILTLKATDQDVGKNAEVEYSIESVTATSPDSNSTTVDAGADRQEFHVDSRTGAFTTRGPLDREKVARYTVVVKATDQTNPATERMSTTATVHVNVLDDNDNYPQFSEKTYTVSVDEDISVSDNPVIATIRATDADVGQNAAVRYAIIGGNTQMQFSIDTLSGDVSLVKPLDYELVKNYRLVIRAQDGGSPSRSNTTQLLVNVKDVNDNVPRFYTSLFQETVSENVPVGFSIVRVQAYDADEGVNAEITYTLSEGDMYGERELPISIDARSGWVYTTRQLDREEQAKYQLQVTATDGGSSPRSATASVVIVIQDVNDNDPAFTPAQYDVELAEDEPPGTPVVTVTATDADEDNRLHYEITGGNTRGRFSITSQNGRGLITVAQPLDFKQEKRYVLTVTATDSGGRSDSAMVHINITDANNYAPVFENAPYTASVFEDAPIGTTVLVVSATDSDVGINAQISYTLSSEISSEPAAHHGQEFLINAQTGAVTTNQLLDRELMSGYLLTVTARDGGSPPLSDTTDVEISVVDVNDNAPQFSQLLYSAAIMEDALLGTSVIQISATDADVGLNGRVVYSLSDTDKEDGSFVIDPSSGVIRTDKALDRESVAAYDLTAIATDTGTPAMSSTVIVHIKIEDINDSPPVFESDTLTFYVPENSPVGTTIGEVHARDPDEGHNAQVHYSIKGGEDSSSFSLVTHQGSDRAGLVSMIDLDYESPRKKYELIIRASSPPLWNDVKVEILVTDVNDNAPMLKDFQIIFNNYKDCFPVGPFGKVPAFDADVTDKLSYRILSGNNANLVLLNRTTGSMTLSPQLNTNVPKLATMEISVTDGVNEIKAVMQLSVRLITEQMLYNSITVRLNDMTAERFLSPLFGYFVDGLAAIIPCPRENIYVFSVQDDTDVSGSILNVSFSARRPAAELAPGAGHSAYYSPTHLKERVYLHRATLAKLATVQVLPFDDNVCVHEPCLNFEECVTVLKFGNATGFITSDTVLFRPIYPVTTFSCQCPRGFTGSVSHYLCDTEVDLCYSSPCAASATCVSTENSYSCVCAPGYTGDRCDVAATNSSCGDVCVGGCPGGSTSCGVSSRSFPKDAFLTLPGIKARHRFNIKLRFATQSSSGLLLYNGRYNERHDFISLETVSTGAGDLSGPGVRFTFSLGGTASEVTVGRRLDDGEWHDVEIRYFNRTATLIVDKCDVRLALAGAGKWDTKFACANRTTKILPSICDVPTETCHRYLDLTGPLQIGGLPNIPSSFQVKNKDYVGCVADLYIDEKLIDLNSYVADNGTIAGCPEKRSHCSSEPCYNGGRCTELWNTFICECTDEYTGKDCGEPTSPPWRFNGDGLLSFNPLLRPIQVPWLNALSIRTRQLDTFLMSIQIGQNSTVLITLKSGYLHYTYNGDLLMSSEVPLNDGVWHRVEITWLGAELQLELEYGTRRTNKGIVGYKVQGQYVGRILIGGDDAAAGLLATELGYFDGCVQDVRVGNSQSLLNRPTVRENVRDGCQSKADCMLSICPPYSTCESSWDHSWCECEPGRAGPACTPLCDVTPCPSRAVCHARHQTVECHCADNMTLTDRGCESKRQDRCPTGWWGREGKCGPCHCDVNKGLHPHCDHDTGACHCKDNHYSLPDSSCVPCACYSVGASNNSCDSTGQCPCTAGVIGRACDSCASVYGEVSHQGCQVVYDGCPKSFSNGVWWPRTKFGEQAVTDCPAGTVGKATRVCDKSQVVPWQEPDMFNCTTQSFYQLKKQLDKLESGELSLNTFVSVRIGEELWLAVSNAVTLYGSDVSVAAGLLRHVVQHELTQHGLNLTHTQHSHYITNLLKSTNAVLNRRYEGEWRRIRELTGQGVEQIVELLDRYITVLAQSQRDTYTNPFEIVETDIVLGVDIVTAESIYGFEPTQFNQNYYESITTERVILPDTSSFIHSPLTSNSYFGVGKKAKRASSPTVSFPKYNNYVKSKSKFDQHSRVLLPLDLIGISSNHIQDQLDAQFESRAVISYTQLSHNASQLLPMRFDESVEKRWGVNISVGSTVMQIAVFVPEHVWKMQTDNTIDNEDVTGLTYANRGNHNQNQISNHVNRNQNPTWPHTNEIDHHEPILIQPTKKEKQTNEENKAPQAMALKMESKEVKSGNSTKETVKMVYKSLSGLRLKRPVRLQMLLSVNRESFGSRTNPQCVHWSTVRGFGEWSRVGCHTEIDYDWSPYSEDPLIINCTCYHLSTFAVLVDEVDVEYIPEPSFLESVSSYTAFSISIPLLFVTWLSLCVVRGGQATVSNSIHKHLLFSILMCELLFFIAMKTRAVMVHNEIWCRIFALSLQYWWVSSVSWSAVSAWQVRRLVREVRDVNHSALTPLLAVGYAAPAVLLALAVSHHQRQYGNAVFCWVSVHESAVWWQVGPVAAGTAAAAALLVSATSAAFTLRDHVTGYGNLRMVLAVNIICLPLLICVWCCSLVVSSEVGRSRALWSWALCVSVLAHALTAALGLLVLNHRVRHQLRMSILKCLGRKVPLADTSVIITGSAHNLSGINRSSLAYHSGTDGGRTLRNIGLTASSTTSRSTTKTSSSPYSRSDGQLRHTSTSTSNYNTSNSDMPAYLRGFDSSLHTKRDESRRRPRPKPSDETENSDSESDATRRRSLDLASSHSSDDDDTNTRVSTSIRERSVKNSSNNYLPNITEGAPLSLNPRWQAQREGSVCASPSALPGPDVTRQGVTSLPSLLDNVHDAYLHNVHTTALRDDRYGPIEGDFAYAMTSQEPDKQISYDPNYPISPTMYRLPNYGSKTYIPSRNSDYSPQTISYSPTKYLNEVYGSRDEFNHREFRDSGIATMLKKDYQRRLESQYGDYDGMSDVSDKIGHDKYLFPYTAEEDHASLRPVNRSPHVDSIGLHAAGEVQQQLGAPLASMGETSEKSTIEDDDETRV